MLAFLVFQQPLLASPSQCLLSLSLGSSSSPSSVLLICGMPWHHALAAGASTPAHSPDFNGSPLPGAFSSGMFKMMLLIKVTIINTVYAQSM